MNNEKSTQGKWYEQFNNKKSVKISTEKNKRKEFNKERNKFYDEKRRGLDKKNKIQQMEAENEGDSKIAKKDAVVLSLENMFNFSNLPQDSIKVLENFDQIVQNVRPLNSRQMQNLPKDIRVLSHQLTDERSSRRTGYMNANQELSAYIRYFAWWNLVRLTRVFANIPSSELNLKDGDVILDIGTGPLTVISALWLSYPELRNLNLTVYAMDISQSTMALGEDIYLSIASKTPPEKKDFQAHWNIIRVKGEIGTSIRKKANLITCANMFNELHQKENESPEKIADMQIKNLFSYADQNCSFFIAEPGMPAAGNFISLMRERFLKKECRIIAPCPHQKKCAMNGNHARYGGSAKWCNFSFLTEDAPKKLLKLSEAAGLPKERAVISFILTTNNKNNLNTNNSELYVDVVSDPIWLSNHKAGFYSCTEYGLSLLVNNGGVHLKSGDKIRLSMLNNIDSLEKDKKTGAIIINVQK